MAVDVNRWNFNHLLPKILRSISNAAFVAIDFEFLGLPLNYGKDSVSLFDTQCERYRKVCDAIRRFPPCQLGLACFQECEDELESRGFSFRKYKADVFCISLFKHVFNYELSFLPSSVGFLAQNGFDFNKFAAEGMTYCNRTEMARLRNEIVSGDFDFELFEEGLAERIQTIKSQILVKMVDESCIFPNQFYNRTRSCKHSVVIELFREGKGCGHDKYMWDRPISSLEEVIMTFALSEAFPDFEFHIDEGRTLLYVKRRPLMFGDPGNEEILNRRQESLEKLFNGISGVSQVFCQIFERKLPIVGHNCLLDLMYIYNCFFADLPATYTEWKREIHEILPVILDTKFLAGTLEDVLRRNGISNLSLRALGNFLTLRPSPTFLPFHPALIVNDESDKVFEHGKYHNAAFDALVTGDVFMKLAHLFVSTKCSSDLYKPLSLLELFFALRNEVTNKIPAPLIHAEYCSMDGADLARIRPDIIEVRNRKHLIWVPSLTFKANVKSVPSKLYNYIFGSMEVCEELEYVRRYLTRIFGYFEVEVRLGSRRKSLEIATNSPTTYARICSFFETSDEYFLMNIESLAYLQRMYNLSRFNDTRSPTNFPECNNVACARVPGRLFLPVFLTMILIYVTRYKRPLIITNFLNVCVNMVYSSVPAKFSFL